MEYLVAHGAPRDKLLLGVPFYGQSFTLPTREGSRDQGSPSSGPGDAGEFSKQPGMLAYYEICNRGTLFIIKDVSSRSYICNT